MVCAAHAFSVEIESRRKGARESMTEGEIRRVFLEELTSVVPDIIPGESG